MLCNSVEGKKDLPVKGTRFVFDEDKSGKVGRYAGKRRIRELLKVKIFSDASSVSILRGFIGGHHLRGIFNCHHLKDPSTVCISEDPSTVSVSERIYRQ